MYPRLGALVSTRLLGLPLLFHLCTRALASERFHRHPQVRQHFPYFNRSVAARSAAIARGAAAPMPTHIFLFAHDEGACWAPQELYEHSIILTHCECHVIPTRASCCSLLMIPTRCSLLTAGAPSLAHRGAHGRAAALKLALHPRQLGAHVDP